VQTGLSTFLGFSSVSGQLPARTQASLRLNLYTVALFPYPASFYQPPSRPPRSFVDQLRSFLPCVADHTGCSPPPTQPPMALRTASFVYVRSPPLSPGLSPAYRGPYRVRVPGDKYFVVDIGGSPTAVSVDRLKPHLGQAPLSPALTLRHGRPPRSRNG
jgi:hypothetical protein